MSNPAITDQMQFWGGDFGREYNARNPRTADDCDALCQRNFGLTRTALNTRFVDQVPRSARILEVGCNVGSQLAVLQRMGFQNLYGVEWQHDAVEQSKRLHERLQVIQGSAFDLPFCDGFFDLVFTSGVLIHIAPTDLPTAMREIHRVSARWIWGFEYHAPTLSEVTYRGHAGRLWKADYAALYTQQCPGLTCVRREQLAYVEGPNIDEMFLLEKAR